MNETILPFEGIARTKEERTMKRKWVIMIVTGVLLIGMLSVAAFAATSDATWKRPSVLYGEMTGKDATAWCGTGQTIWQAAAEEGTLDELKATVLANAETRADALVADGTWTREQAVAWLADLEARVDEVDGVDVIRPARGAGIGCGAGYEAGLGAGGGRGCGMGGSGRGGMMRGR